MNVVVEILSILSIATKEMEQSLTSAPLLRDSSLDPSHIFFREISKKISRKNRYRGWTEEIGQSDPGGARNGDSPGSEGHQ